MTTVLISLLKETIMALVGKIAFKTIFERALSRLVITSLEKLEKMTTNSVAKGTVSDILNQLKGKDLKIIDELTR